MTAPKSFGGFSQDDVRKYLEEQKNQEDTKPKEKVEKKGRKKKTPEVPAVPAVPVRAPVPSKQGVLHQSVVDPQVFGITDRYIGAIKTTNNYTMSGVNFIDRYFTVDFDTDTFPIGEKSQQDWIRYANEAIDDEPLRRSSYVGCAPLYYSIWKTLYDNKDNTVFSKVIESARSEIGHTLNTKKIMTTSQVVWNITGLEDLVMHDQAIPEPYSHNYRNNADIKGLNGSMKNAVVDAGSACKAIFDTPNCNEVCSVLEWLTGREPFLMRVGRQNTTPRTCPVLFEPGKFVYINTTLIPTDIHSGGKPVDAAKLSNAAFGMPVYVYGLPLPKGGSP
jgi:hypothetical protein